MNSLTEEIDCVSDIRPSDSEVEKMPNEAAKGARIGNRRRGLSTQLVILLDGRRAGTSGREARISKNVQDIFSLIDDYAAGRTGYLNAQKELKWTQILDSEAIMQEIFDALNERKIIPGENDIINVDESHNKGSGSAIGKQRVISVNLQKTKLH
ncbi:unnamed protein product [Linum trigynum]|uniref:Uncharacterized protein n=1 Tax=Linum trigynum TaxID=586398 RepID=A0AAV2DZG4_9ROSI